MTDPVYVNPGPWGSGLGRPIHSIEGDFNFYNLTTRVAYLEANPAAAISIASITQSGSQIYVHLTDSSILGPFDLPVLKWVFRGDWAAATLYAAGDVFTHNGTVYQVLLGHTSAGTFDPGANDGLGHNYYAVLLTLPSGVLPTGGTTNQALAKTSGTDYAVGWKTILPNGGATHTIPWKLSATDLDIAWATPAAVATAEINLENLKNVNISSPANGDLIKWDNATSKWVKRGALAFTEITGTATAVQVRQATVTTLGATGTVSLDPTLGDVFKITPTGAVTLNAASAPAGAQITLLVITSGTTSYNITFNTNFVSTGVLATGTVDAKAFAVCFVSEGTKFYETSRTVAM